MFSGPSSYIICLLLAVTSQLVLGTPLTPKYNGNWLELKGNRFQGIYKSDHAIPPGSLGGVLKLAAANLVKIYESLPQKPPTAPMGLTVYQNTVGDIVFASSGDGEHGEELAARIAPEFHKGAIATYSLNSLNFIPACGPGARNCEGLIERANIRDIGPEIAKTLSATKPQDREPSPVSPKDSPEPEVKVHLDSGSHSSSGSHRRSPDYPAPFVDLRRGFQSLTPRDVRAALMEGIREREALERRQDLLFQHYAALRRRELQVLEDVY